MTLKKTFDGFMNVVKGIGSDKDITSDTGYYHKYRTLLQKTMNDLYSTNWAAAKCVNIPIDDAFREEREFQCEDAEALEEFKKECKRLDIDNKIKTAMKWADVFGGAVIIINSKDDELSEPLDLNNFSQGDLVSLTVLDRWDIYPQQLQTQNPLRSDYLEAQYYTLSKSGGLIHNSRVIKFNGENTTNYNKQLMQGFGISKYEKLYQSIMNSTMSPDLLINLLTQSNLDVYKVEGLKENLLEDGGDDLLIKRFNTVNKAKSVLNSVLIDKEDDYINIAKNFAGLSEVNKQFYQVLSGAADIPFNRFMGQGASGLANTGEGDLKNYYDMVSSKRNEAGPAYEKLDKVIQLDLFSEDKNISYEFPSLFQLSDKEQAELDNKKANTDSIYLDRNVISEFDVKARLAQDENYPTITPESIEEERKLLEEYSTE